MPGGYTSMTAKQVQEMLYAIGADLDAEGTGH